MAGIATLLYGLFCYAVCLASFLYLIAFSTDLVVPWRVDHGRIDGGPAALWIDLALIALFSLQHSGMARRGYKRWLGGWLPQAVERSTYVLASSLVLALLYWQWRSLPGVLWQFDGTAAYLIYALCAFGWLLVFTATFVINHFDLFGLRQVWLRARGRNYSPLPFQLRWYYRIVRHPLMLGFLIAFWATPHMGYGHLLFAIGMSAYILLAVRIEERDLVVAHGEDYRRYQREVPMLLPRVGGRSGLAP